MENLQNINWESERGLVQINDLDHQVVEDGYAEEDWNISFEYKGHKLTAVIDFTLELKQYDDEDTNTHDIDVVSIDLTIKEMLTDNEYIFGIPTKEEVRLQNQLAIELKVQF